jgi:hypothetical protein
MLAGLKSWWLGAISAPFLDYHWTSRSLILGYGLGVAVAIATIAWAVRQTHKISVRSLLGGHSTDDGSVLATGSNNAAKKPPAGLLIKLWLLIGERVPLAVPLVIAVLLSGVATKLGGMAQAGAFVGGGAALLVVLLLFVRRRLRRQGQAAGSAWERPWLLWSLAERSAARNPGRSVITVALMATATFLIVAGSDRSRRGRISLHRAECGAGVCGPEPARKLDRTLRITRRTVCGFHDPWPSPAARG